MKYTETIKGKIKKAYESSLKGLVVTDKRGGARYRLGKMEGDITGFIQALRKADECYVEAFNLDERDSADRDSHDKSPEHFSLGDLEEYFEEIGVVKGISILDISPEAEEWRIQQRDRDRRSREAGKDELIPGPPGKPYRS